MNNKYKIVFMGTPDFSVPTLKKLYANYNIDLCAVVTKADTRSCRGNKINFSAIKSEALNLSIPIYQPMKIKNDNVVIDELKKIAPDFIIVVAYGEILSKEILDIPKYACINGHASLLPLYRGSSPIQSAILNGDKKTGITTMLMDEGLDTGDILLKKEINIDVKETSDSLFDKLSVLTADTILDTINDFNNITPIKQDDSRATKSSLIKKEYGKINLSNETAIEIDRKIRAYTSWPSAYIELNDELIKIWDVDVISSATFDGTLKNNTNNIKNKNNINNINKNFFIFDNKLYAKCKNDYIKINILQKPGKNKITSKDFINALKNEISKNKE